MNRFFKGLIITTFVILGLTVIAGFFIFHQLPSLKSISSVLGSKKKVSKAIEAAAKTSAISESPVIDPSSVSAPPAVIDGNGTTKPETTTMLSDRFLDDMMSRDKPLSDFCRSLASSKMGAFSSKDFNKAFSDSFESAKPDPRIQAAKPLLRYVFRLPQMQNLLSALEEAAAKNDESFMDKAQFYTAAVAAYAEMREHQADMESLLDRSYLFMGLNNLIAKKPELAEDPRVQNFCLNTENLFNQAAAVDFETEKNNFLNLVHESSLTPKDISFNPDYKSNIDFNFDGKSLTFSGGWLDDLVKEDVGAGTTQGAAQNKSPRQ